MGKGQKEILMMAINYYHSSLGSDYWNLHEVYACLLHCTEDLRVLCMRYNNIIMPLPFRHTTEVPEVAHALLFAATE